MQAEGLLIFFLPQSDERTARMVRKEKKPEIVDRFTEKLTRAEVAIATDYRGLTVAQITDLRRRFRKEGIEYHIIKNTLAGFAASNAGKSDLTQLLKGPTAIAFGYDDPVQAPKILLEFLKSGDEIPLTIKGGLLGNRLLSTEDVTGLAKLPPKEDLIAKIIGTMQSPIYGLLFVLNGNLRGLANVLQARVKQMEEGV